MIVDDQKAVTEFLAHPGETGAHAEVIETHISRIFLSADTALKMKRAVKLPYVDFSTPQLRLQACEKEVFLNSRTAPGLYRGVRRINRDERGRLSFGGPGELADAVIDMARFDQSCLLDAMALKDELTPELMTSVSRMIAAFHAGAPVIHSGGGAANMAAVLSINEAGFRTSHVFGDEETASLNLAFRRALDRHGAHLDRREGQGKIRRCHGDLHLRNICLLDGQPRLFDCIEFNDAIATVDVLYDLAFLLMDLWHRGFFDLANLVMNRYLDETGDDDGFTLLPFFMAVRAAVRAHVTATQIEETAEPVGGKREEARAYFNLALELLKESPALLVAVGGLSGSGKTTAGEACAARLGPPPGARIVESDRIRKALHGVAAETRLPDDAYRPEVSRRVYTEITQRSVAIAAAGGTVLADAVFDRNEDRDAIEQAALDAGVPFAGFWLDAPAQVLRQRVAARKGGPSDAGLEVLERQLSRFSGEVSWRKINAALALPEVVAALLSAVEALPASGPARPDGGQA
ncbi:MAG TPA: AAA family ATPase [Rhizobiaceae bacterium]|nr:AAA family ATPase [Rhizobiaceae bacterium]